MKRFLFILLTLVIGVVTGTAHAAVMTPGALQITLIVDPMRTPSDGIVLGDGVTHVSTRCRKDAHGGMVGCG